MGSEMCIRDSNTNYAGFNGLDLSPIGPIEYYLNTVYDDLNNRLSYSLHDNYPNPFNPKTILSYYLPKETYVTLTVYNIRRQLIKILVDGFQPGGLNAIAWDATNSSGNQVTTGLYIYRIKTPEFEDSKISVFIK